MRRIIPITLIALFSSSFVLMYGNNHSKLAATREQPEIFIVWDGKAPPMTHTDWRKDMYKDLKDTEIMHLLIAEGLNMWSEIPGSYLRLKFAEVDENITFREEGIHSITVVENDENSTFLTAAYARPKVDVMDPSIIQDCDIVFPKRKLTTLAVARTVFHEIGHCVGLGHPHESYTSIMSYSSSAKQLTLTADDKAGVIYLYPDSGDGSYKDIYGQSCGSLGTWRKNTLHTSSVWWLFAILALPLIVWRKSSHHTHKTNI